MSDIHEEIKTAQFLDVFKEIGNIGTGNATTALAMMLNKRIDMSLPNARMVPFAEVSDILGGPEQIVIGILINMSVDLNGYILLVLGVEDGLNMASLLTGSSTEDIDYASITLETIDEMNLSALNEIANILIGSYLTAIAHLTNLRIEQSIPDLVIDMAGAIMSVPAIEYGTIGDEVLMLETNFSSDGTAVAGHFFLVPDLESYHVLLRSLGMLPE